MNNQFSENLKKIRKDHKLSQEQLADELGVSRQAISKWESAAAYPEMDKIIALCDKFNINIDDLLHKDIKEIKREEESKNKINKSIEDFLKFLTNTVNMFASMNFKSKIKCLFEQLIIIFILFILSTIIVGICATLFENLLSILPNQLSYYLKSILDSIIILFCTVSSVIIVINIFKTRYLDYYEKTKVKNNNKQNLEDNKNQTKATEDKIIIRDPKHSEYKFLSSLFKLIIVIIKFFALCFAAFICLIIIGLFISFVLSFLVYKTGLFFIGLLIAIIASSIIAIIILLIILNFVFNRKNDKKKLIWSFIIALIALGMGIGLAFIGTLNFEIIENNETMSVHKYLELEMTDNTFFHSNNINFKESDIDNIKLEYKINKYCQLELVKSQEDGVYTFTNCINSPKIIKEYLKNINNKKIIPLNSEIQEITLYASKANIEKIKQNKTTYLEKRKAYEETINAYEKRIQDLETSTKNYENQIYELNDQLEEYKNKINQYQE